MADEEYLRLENLSKVFTDHKKKEFTAVNHLSLSVNKGEFLTLLGPSGCGKTTILRMIAGFEQPTEGEIFIGGRLVTDLTPDKRDTSMVFQNYALFPHLNIYDNIAYGLKVRKKSTEIIRNDVAMACQIVNLVGLEHRFPSELSGGQQQRVALARALVLKPEMILFDEPLSNLDNKLRSQTRTEIKRVQQILGITVLYVTHDQSEALSLSDRVVVMNRGEIVQTGHPADIYNHPENIFVADFIGNVNFIESRVEEVEGNRITVTLQNRQIVLKQDNKEGQFHEGEEISLAIKPEAISISSEPGNFHGIVDVTSFLGPMTEIKIDFEGSFITLLQSHTETGFKHYSMGEKVYLNFNRALFQIYKR